VDLYFVLPFAHECLQQPHDSAIWLGWLTNSELVTYIAATTVLDAVSTGLVIEGTCNVQSWIEYVVADQLDIPVIQQWRIYDAPAAGGNQAVLEAVGSAGGLSNVKDGSRIAGIFELHDLLGFGGADGADNITSVAIPQLGQDVTVHIDGFFSSYRRIMGGRRGPGSGVGTTIIHDGGGNPHTLEATPNAQLHASTALYTPWRAPGTNAQLTKMPKFAGDLRIVRTFTTAPSSGRHRFALNEFRELHPSKKDDLLRRAGAQGAKLERNMFRHDLGDVVASRRFGKLDALPERVLR
jgi:hypothetical protein